MEWLDLVVPSAAIFAVFLGIALLVQSIRHGRAIRRLEESLAERGQAADEASLERVKELQTRISQSQGTGGAPSSRALGGAAIVVVLVALVAGGAWFLLIRDSGGSSGEASAEPTVRTATTASPVEADPPPREADRGAVGSPTPLADKSQFSVAIFNASGIDGAANNQVAPAVIAEGYQVGLVTDSPDGRDDLSRSVVMYPEGKRNVARNLARDLGIMRAPPLDGITEEQLDGADVAVLIGTDITATPTTP